MNLQNPRIKKLPKKLREAASLKIKKLIREGYPQKRAVAAALKMASQGKLGPRGGYKRNPIPDKELWNCLVALAVLSHHPTWTENFSEDVLDALESEGLWNYEEGVTKKGRDFLEGAYPDFEND